MSDFRRLFITNQHLRFVANRFDHRTGGRDWTMPRDEVGGVLASDRTLQGGPFSGGLRRRLQVQSATDAEHFVVNDLDELVGFLAAWAQH